MTERPPAPVAADQHTTVAEANHEEAMQIATDLRAAGRARTDVIDQLHAYGLGVAVAEQMVDEADFVAGILGRPHPADITTAIRARIDAEAMLLPVSNYRVPPRQNAPRVVAKTHGESSEEITARRAMSSARQMLVDGKSHDEIVTYLEDLGCPTDQASAAVEANAAELAIARDTFHRQRKGAVFAAASKAAFGVGLIIAGTVMLLLGVRLLGVVGPVALMLLGLAPAGLAVRDGLAISDQRFRF